VSALVPLLHAWALASAAMAALLGLLVAGQAAEGRLRRSLLRASALGEAPLAPRRPPPLRDDVHPTRGPAAA
jgi:hypothetical protein